jgi:hypothetical protein
MVTTRNCGTGSVCPRWIRIHEIELADAYNVISLEGYVAMSGEYTPTDGVPT